MSLQRSLDVASIGLGESASDRDAVLSRIVELAAKNPLSAGLKPRRLLKQFVEREELSSTGLGRGIAVPHCSSDRLDEFVVGLLVLEEGVDFKSLDGEPTDVFLFIVGPRDARNQHIKLLSEVAKALSRPEVIDHIRSSKDPQAVRALLDAELDLAEEEASAEKVLFHVFVQNMDHFEDILNLLSAAIPGSISVIETRNAGAYLFSMPLFAAFWSEQAAREGRIITAVAEKTAANSLIRQITEITGDPDRQKGVMVTVQNLSYAAGSLDF